MFLESDGSIVVAGVAPTGLSTFPLVVARYTPDGSLDTFFGNNGVALVSDITTPVNTAVSMALEPDGRIVVAGMRIWAQTGNASPFVARFLDAGPQVGSFTASAANPVAAGSSVTLTASNVVPLNPGTTVTQVEFYYVDASSTQQVLGYGTSDGLGDWSLTFTVSLPTGTYTLFAQAKDSDGVFSDPVALTLQVL
jgi:hypothetical protein